MIKYDVAERIWRTMPEMQTTRCSFSAVSLHNMIWAIGGHDGTNSLDSVEVFNISQKRSFFILLLITFLLFYPFYVNVLLIIFVIIIGGQKHLICPMQGTSMHPLCVMVLFTLLVALFSWNVIKLLPRILSSFFLSTNYYYY